MSEIKKINYQKLNQELEEVLEKLQAGDLDIDRAMKYYERGITIAKQMEDYLCKSQIKINKLKKNWSA